MFYLVKEGAKPGIYTKQKEAFYQVVRHKSGGKMKAYETLEEVADAVRNRYYYLVVCGGENPGVYTDFDYVTKLLSGKSFQKILFFPTERQAVKFFRSLKRNYSNNQKWYTVVTKGDVAVCQGYNQVNEYMKKSGRQIRHTYSFLSKNEAEHAAKKFKDKSCQKMHSFAERNNCKPPYAYIDGSYDSNTETGGYGCVFFESDRGYPEILKGPCYQKKTKNVAAELAAATAAIKKAISIGAKTFTIFYDYVGVKDLTCTENIHCDEEIAEYQNFVKEASEKMSLNFVKVAAHTCVRGNEAADFYAKSFCKKEG